MGGLKDLDIGNGGCTVQVFIGAASDRGAMFKGINCDEISLHLDFSNPASLVPNCLKSQRYPFS
jgi:hypothetical protein